MASLVRYGVIGLPFFCLSDARDRELYHGSQNSALSRKDWPLSSEWNDWFTILVSFRCQRLLAARLISHMYPSLASSFGRLSHDSKMYIWENASHQSSFDMLSKFSICRSPCFCRSLQYPESCPVWSAGPTRPCPACLTASDL